MWRTNSPVAWAPWREPLRPPALRRPGARRGQPGGLAKGDAVCSEAPRHLEWQRTARGGHLRCLV